MVRHCRGELSVGELRRTAKTASASGRRDVGRAGVTQAYAAGELEDCRLTAGEKCRGCAGEGSFLWCLWINERTPGS